MTGLRHAEPILAWLRSFRLRTLGQALLLVLLVRLVFLLRFGDCPNWMGFHYLSQAKNITVLGISDFEQQPLVTLLLLGLRGLGLSPTGALGAIYLLAHLAFAGGVLSLGSRLWPQMTQRRRLLLIGTLAVVPLLSGVWGHANIGTLLGASLAVCALAFAARAASSISLTASSATAAALCATLGALCRYEALAACVCGGAALWFLGPRIHVVQAAPRRAAAALVVGAALGIFGLWIAQAMLGGSGEPSGYGFYTFYDGLPFLMWPDVPEHSDELGRYLASRDYFGSFADNDGSLARALLSNPGAAAMRFVTKAPEIFAALAWPESLTPVGVVLALIGLRGLRGTRPSPGAVSSGWLLLAYVGPLLVVFVPTPAPPYLLALLPPLLFAMARGLERLTVRLSERAFQRLGLSLLVVGLLYVTLLGRTQFASSPVITQAAEYLERRCAAGCLTNFLPQALDRQAWVNLAAGSPYPRKKARSEEGILKEYPAEYRKAFRFHDRVRKARENGYSGPVLVARFDVASTQLFHPVFDPEVRYEGRIDLTGATLEREFTHGVDRIRIYALPAPSLGAVPATAQAVPPRPRTHSAAAK